MKKKDLSKKELELYETLVRLGDSESLALKTVLCERDKNQDHSMYEFAYYS